MSSGRIGTDVERFKSIVKGKVRQDIKRFVSSESFEARQGGKVIHVPLNSLDIPKFSFGSNKQNGGGVGTGDDDSLNPGQGKKKGKGNKAGDSEEENSFGVDFTPEELAEMLIQELELPNLEEKNSGKLNQDKVKYNKINPQGVIRHNKRTYLRAMSRQVSSGTYMPDNPVIIPIRSDYRYKTTSDLPSPIANAVSIFLLDISGSMGENERENAKNVIYWINCLLTHHYSTIESVFLIHDTASQEVSQEEFFKASSGGGTKISSGYEKISELIEKEYPFSDYNTYIYHFSDGDNLSGPDNDLCRSIIKEKLLPNCNAFNFCLTKSPHGSGEFATYLEENFPNENKITIATSESKDDTLSVIKAFFEKGH
jgi:uncharacterized sporulation protein YeaH/YhbH (DUF444 family)